MLSYAFKTTIALLLSFHSLGRAQSAFAGSDNHHPQRKLNGDSFAIAYRCDETLNEISLDEALTQRSKVRICVERTTRAKLKEIYISKVGNFHFRKDEEVQQVIIEDGQEMDENTRLYCEPGSNLCYFETIPNDDFFNLDGIVNASGNIFMQFGIDRRQLTTDASLRGRSRKIMEMTSIMDTISTVEAIFSVRDARVTPSITKAVLDYWNKSPAHMKVLYSLLLALVLVFIGFVLFGLLFWSSCCSDTKKIHNAQAERRRRKLQEIAGPYIVKKDDQTVNDDNFDEENGKE
jgi:hypothetical protein